MHYNGEANAFLLLILMYFPDSKTVSLGIYDDDPDVVTLDGGDFGKLHCLLIKSAQVVL